MPELIINEAKQSDSYFHVRENFCLYFDKKSILCHVVLCCVVYVVLCCVVLCVCCVVMCCVV